MSSLTLITHQVEQALQELLLTANLKKKDILVVGCSTSEIGGNKIGSNSSLEIADAVLDGIDAVLNQIGIFLAIQCCEHLNRALLVEKACADTYHLEEVCAVPYQHAGGSLATEARQRMTKPLLVERITARAGMDIGDTFIGMHLHRVVIPVRASITQVGEAHLTMAHTRPPYIGGERTRYQ